MRVFLSVCFIGIALSLLLSGCKNEAPAKEYDIKGKVTAINAKKPTVTLDHEDIPGVMKAMEMPFDVEDPKVLEGIKVGDEVKGRIKKTQSGFVVTRLEKR
jgi:protein SCO1/2